MDTDSFIVYIKEMIFIKILENMLKLDLILLDMVQIDYCLKKKNEKVIELMKDELVEKIIKKFVGLTAKTQLLKNSHLIEDGSDNKKAKGTKKIS